jgi:hypothetical protein
MGQDKKQNPNLKIRKISLIEKREPLGVYRKFEGVVDEVVDRALTDLEWLLMQGKEVVALEAMRPMVQFIHYYINTVLQACWTFAEELKALEGRLGEVITKVVRTGKAVEELIQTFGGIPEELDRDRIPKDIAEVLVKLNLAKMEGNKVVFHRIEDIYQVFAHCSRVLARVFKVR